MAKRVKPIPEGFRSLTPSLTLKNCAAALDFYKRAFGAEEIYVLRSPDGKIAHAELKIGDSILMLGDEFDFGHCRSPQTLGGSTGALHIYIPEVDQAFERAVQAGAEVKTPVADMFWGDRYGVVTDPFGHMWGLATHVEDLSPAEIEERAKDFYAKMGQAA
jgi:PhnB protein